MYQVKLSDGLEVRVTGDLCKVIDRNAHQLFAGNHDETADWCARGGYKGFGPAPQRMWTGLVTRRYAEYVMGAPASAGGFVARDIPLQDGTFLAAIPASMSPPDSADGTRLPMDKFRVLLIRTNAHMYLGRGEDYADAQGFATEARIQDLLDRLTDSEPTQHQADDYDAAQASL